MICKSLAVNVLCDKSGKPGDRLEPVNLLCRPNHALPSLITTWPSDYVLTPSDILYGVYSAMYTYRISFYYNQGSVYFLNFFLVFILMFRFKSLFWNFFNRDIQIDRLNRTRFLYCSWIFWTNLNNPLDPFSRQWLSEHWTGSSM